MVCKSGARLKSHKRENVTAEVTIYEYYAKLFVMNVFFIVSH